MRIVFGLIVVAVFMAGYASSTSHASYTKIIRKKMAFLGKRSLMNLSEARWNLQKVTQRAITKIDFAVIDVHRTQPEQEIAFASGNSKAHFGESPHNIFPSAGLDFIPYPLDWKNREGFKKVKIAFQIAISELKIEHLIPETFELEFGYDWGGWDDGHIEIKGWRGQHG